MHTTVRHPFWSVRLPRASFSLPRLRIVRRPRSYAFPPPHRSPTLPVPKLTPKPPDPFSCILQDLPFLLHPPPLILRAARHSPLHPFSEVKKRPQEGQIVWITGGREETNQASYIYKPTQARPAQDITQAEGPISVFWLEHRYSQTTDSAAWASHTTST